MVAKTALRQIRESYHHGNLEEELVFGALKLISKSGPENFSLRSLAGDLGVSPSAVYHYYSDKESLIENLCIVLFDELADLQTKAIEKITGNSARAACQRFRAIGASYFAWASKEPHLFQMMFAGHTPQVKSSKAGDSRAYQMLSESLDELMEHGLLDPKIRPYGELIAWSAVQGATSLIVEGILSPAQFDDLLDGLELALLRGK